MIILITCGIVRNSGRRGIEGASTLCGRSPRKRSRAASFFSCIGKLWVSVHGSVVLFCFFWNFLELTGTRLWTYFNYVRGRLLELAVYLGLDLFSCTFSRSAHWPEPVCRWEILRNHSSCCGVIVSFIQHMHTHTHTHTRTNKCSFF